MLGARRIIDANANRAREALRVMEDAARFLLDDASLAGACKSLRHDLASALEPLGGPELAMERDTPGDVGTALTDPREGERAGAREVVAAAGKRLSEALRSLEEYAKTLEPGAGARFEALRYRGYEAERLLASALGGGRGPQWRLCVLVSEALCAHDAWDVVCGKALRAGADCIQLREKGLGDAQWAERARAVVRMAEDHNAWAVVNDRVDIALAARAHGVHLGQGDLSVADARRVCGGRLRVGVSVSSVGQAERAARDGADYCGVGAMFETGTKHKDEIAGPGLMRAYAERGGALPPHLAIGGITAENAAGVVSAGARGLAVSSAVCGAADPGAVVERLLEIVGGGSA